MFFCVFVYAWWWPEHAPRRVEQLELAAMPPESQVVLLAYVRAEESRQRPGTGAACGGGEFAASFFPCPAEDGGAVPGGNWFVK